MFVHMKNTALCDVMYYGSDFFSLQHFFKRLRRIKLSLLSFLYRLQQVLWCSHQQVPNNELIFIMSVHVSVT
jgi:hypothetical protein